MLKSSNRSRVFLTIVLLCVFVAGVTAAILVGISGGTDQLFHFADAARQFAGDNQWLLLVCSGVIYFAVISANVPLAMPAAFLVGAILGFQQGLFVCVLSATGGCIVAFLYLRHIARDWVESKEKLKPALKRLNSSPTLFVMVARMTPMLPYFLVNGAAAISRISTSRYAIATFIGFVPKMFLYVSAGSEFRSVMNGGTVNMQVLLLIAVVASCTLVTAKVLAKRPIAA